MSRQPLWSSSMQPRVPELGRFAEPALLILVSLSDPPLHYMLLMTDLSRSDAVGAQLDVVIPWLERRLSMRDHAAPQG